MTGNELDDLIVRIKKRYEEVGLDKNPSKRERFVMHLQSLGHWEKDPMDYPEEATATFPESVHVAFAVCHPNCGRREFIVEGSTQECQRCGSNMFRISSQEYAKKPLKGSGSKHPRKTLSKAKAKTGRRLKSKQ